MSNFGFNNLIIVSPKCDPYCEEARRRAMHGLKILENSKITTIDYLNKIDIKVSTTSKTGGVNNVFRAPITAEQLAKIISEKNITKNKKDIHISLVFGRESIGLTNQEIEKCNIISTIKETNPKNKALNLSHAVAIYLYEIKKQEKSKQNENIKQVEKKNQKNEKTEKQKKTKFANHKDLEILDLLLDKVLEKLDYNEQKKQSTKIVFTRIFGKAILTKKEATTIMGFFRNILKSF